MIGVINIGLGNTESVLKTLRYLEYEFEVVTCEQNLKSFDTIIFPGVGTFDVVTHRLKTLGLFDHLKEYIFEERKYLGICLGMQLLAALGDEGSGAEGFGYIDGNVVKMPATACQKLPHIGWNQVKHDESGIFHNIPSEADFYFVHSYCVNCQEDIKMYETDYSFTSYLNKKNAFGVQFHPEKSQKYGLQLIRNFLETC